MIPYGLLDVGECSTARRVAVPAQVERVDTDAEAQQARDERAVSLDVALRVLTEAVLEQQDGARMGCTPRVAPNAGADVPVFLLDGDAQGARFAGASPRYTPRTFSGNQSA